jgi:hypothetical protein
MLSQTITRAETAPNPAALGDEPCVARDVVLRHLKDPAEIEGVLHLRDEIDLSVHAAGGLQQFESLEKKETSAGSCSLSTCTASGSAPSASFRWATASR